MGKGESGVGTIKSGARGVTLMDNCRGCLKGTPNGTAITKTNRNYCGARKITKPFGLKTFRAINTNPFSFVMPYSIMF